MSEVEALASPDPATTDWVPMYAVGSGLNYVGLYDPARTYNDGDIVIGADGVEYLCVINGTTGVTPTPWAPTAFGLVGAPIPWLSNTLPNGYIGFDGQTITQPAYPKLYALFGATMPNLQGLSLLGASGTYLTGTMGGEASHTLSEAEIPAHFHNRGDYYIGGVAENPGAHISTSAGSGFYTNNGNPYVGDGTGTGRTGGGAAHNNLPPYYAVRWITVAG
jgi:microcystin-dependent protein